MRAAVAGAVDISGPLYRVTAGHDPSRVAVRCHGGAELTYGELERRSNRLAHMLIAAGIGPGAIVAVLLERGPELVAAELAIMKAGAAWMPLDPRHPPARLEFQVTDAAAALLLTTADLAASAPDIPMWRLDDAAARVRVAEYPDTPPDVDVAADDAAYLMYTSGSTGAPKGVLVSHRSAYAYCRNAVEQLKLTAADRIPQIANPAFDVTVFDCYATLLAGATLIAAGHHTFTDPAALTALLWDERITVAYVPPAILGVLDPGRLAGGPLRALFCAGAVLSTDVANRWARPGLAIHNAYGPTETTVICTSHPLPATPLSGPVPIGTPLPNHRIYVLDRRLRPVPIGAAGELYIAGSGVALGYLNRSALTATRFLPDPFAPGPGQRMYASGDRGRWRSDGVVEFLGRVDRQVKLRGYRIELGEIEHALAAHPAVTHCAVLMRDDTYLAAYVTGAAGGAEPDAAQLRDHLAARLPAYMVPTVFVVLAALPLTSNGKLDLAALPDPEAVSAEHVPPRTDTERWLARTWQELLGVDEVGAGDNFFTLGGNSLHGTQLIARIGEQLRVELGPRQLFGTPVLGDLAQLLDASEAAPVADAVTAVARGESLPCTHQQEGLWFLHRMDPASSAYHMSVVLRLAGPLDIAALTRAVQDLVVRHEALRTRFVEVAGRPRQVIDPPRPHSLPVTEVGSARIRQWAAAEVNRSFDPAAGSLFRIALARQAPADHVLVLVAHHIIADGWSMRILTGELSELYAAACRGESVELPAVRVQPADHAVWQRRRFDAAETKRQVDYWRGALAGVATVEFPVDRPRTLRHTGAGAAVLRRFPDELTATARGYARDGRVSFLAVLQAALLIVLNRYTGQHDLTVGSIFSGRTRAELEPVVGFFANTVVLRTDAGGDPSFAELVRRCHDTVLVATERQDIPFGLIVDALQPERVPGRNPLFQISLSLQPARGRSGDMALGAATVAAIDVFENSARFDLALDVVDTPDGGLELSAEYATELFDADRIERLLGHLLTALAGGLATPDRAIGSLALLSDGERRLLAAWNDTGRDTTSRTLPDGFRRAAAAHPAAIAVVSGDVRLTYAELRGRVLRLARRLAAGGVAPETVVGLAIRRSIDLVVAMYAILEAGAAYLPIDPDHPPQRVAAMVAAARPLLVLSTTRDAVVVDRVPVIDVDVPAPAEFSDAEWGAGERPGPVRPDHPAYVLFTSGSTGLPKGVVVPHGAIANQIDWMIAHFRIGPGDVYLQKTATVFDVSLWGFFVPPAAGATLVLASPDGHRDPGYLARTIAENGVTVTDFVPSMLSVFAARATAGELRTLRRILSVGEQLSPEVATAVRSLPGVDVHNLYGPTETAVAVTDHRCDDADRFEVPIGAPVWNTRFHVLDSRLRPVPLGVVGELYVGGAQLARGYAGRPGGTAARFVADPFGGLGGRLYRTGDLVRWNAIGELVFRGRIDDQVKIRGFRVEPGEAERALARHPDVIEAAVVARPAATGVRLAGYAVLAGGRHGSGGALRSYLLTQLPEYLVPASILVVEQLPATPSGKLDRKALPEPAFVAETGYRAARTERERSLAALFAEVLAVERVGVDDGFFELGGNSLQAARLVGRIRSELGVDIPIRTVLEASTVAELATRFDNEARESDFDRVLVLKDTGAREPLWCLPPGGGLGWCYQWLGEYVTDRPVHAVQSRGIDGDAVVESFPALIEDYLQCILGRQPQGPFLLLGWSHGGTAAHAVACELVRRGHAVEFLGIIDAAPEFDSEVDTGDRGIVVEERIEERINDRVGHDVDSPRLEDLVQRVRRVALNNVRLLENYYAPVYSGAATIFAATLDADGGPIDGVTDTFRTFWRRHVEGELRIFGIDCAHYDFMQPAPMREIGRRLGGLLP
ncbi:non-ribosomal peptide synthetase [Nocardia sp. BMG111209]|uniref:non-ribosomal peptide synthetase n=1 Tax=Nocardia sp. BMG111209 TaxID=1160137 RepID=UPI000368F689|nr:non-ribosomal peptide synthetase [Nocardia sp. BMG111209]